MGATAAESRKRRNHPRFVAASRVRGIVLAGRRSPDRADRGHASQQHRPLLQGARTGRWPARSGYLASTNTYSTPVGSTVDITRAFCEASPMNSTRTPFMLLGCTSLNDSTTRSATFSDECPP